MPKGQNAYGSPSVSEGPQYTGKHLDTAPKGSAFIQGTCARPHGDKNWSQLRDASSPEAGYSPSLLLYRAEAVCQRLLRSLIAPPFEGHHSPMHFHSEPEMTRNEERLDGVNATYSDGESTC